MSCPLDRSAAVLATLCLAAALLQAVPAVPVAAQDAPREPELVRDLTPGTVDADTLIRGADSVRLLGDRVVLLAERAQGDLWVTDGTPEGTDLLADLRAGAQGFTRQQEIVDRVGDRLVIDAHSGVWITDGTPAGTRHLGLDPSARYLGAAGDELLFLIAAASPRRVEVVDPATGGRRSFVPPVNLFDRGGSAGERLVLLASPGGSDAIASTDGTAFGTEVLVAAPAGEPFGELHRFTPVEERVFFFAGSEPEARLWVSDGTAGGTRELPVPGEIRVRDFGSIPDPDGYGVAVVTTVGGSHSLWVSDGTAAGTRSVLDGEPGVTLALAGPPAWSGGRLAFGATDVVHGDEPWVFEPAAAGTGDGDARLLADVCQGPCSSDPRSFAPVVDGFFLVAPAGEFGLLSPRVVSFDGAVRGLSRFPGPEPDGYELVAELADRYVVAAGNAVGAGALLTMGRGTGLLASGDVLAGAGRVIGARVVVPVGNAVVSTDGTFTGTAPLAGLGPVEPAPSRLERLVVSGPRLFFLRGGEELWVSDGTGPGTSRVPGPLADESVFHVFDVGSADGGVFVLGDGNRLWWTDGTAAGTVGFERSVGSVDFEKAWLLGGELVALEAGVRLVRTDRSSGALVPLVDGRVTAVGRGAPGSGELYVATAVDEIETETGVDTVGTVWVTDGTPEGTEPLFETGLVDALAWFRGELHSLVADGADLGLRASDDSRVGPGEVVAVLGRSGGSSGSPRVLAAGDALFFAYRDRAGGLWATDGTAAGTGLLIEEPVDDVLVVGDRVAVVTSSQPGSETLWWSDGAVGGTVPVEGFLPEIGDLLPVDGRLLVSAASHLRGATGAELWLVDGPRTAPRLVVDLAPGPASSAPAEMVELGPQIVFVADDGTTGRELWALGTSAALDPPDRPDRPPLVSPAVPGFRVWVEITPQGQAPIAGSAESADGACIPETLCVSGALAGRTEAFVRVIGPRPNGLLWPVVTRFTPSRVEVWIEQVSTGDLRYYDLSATDPEGGELSGLFDRQGFVP